MFIVIKESCITTFSRIVNTKLKEGFELRDFRTLYNQTSCSVLYIQTMEKKDEDTSI